MIDYNIIKIKNTWENKIVVKNISLDYKLDFFMTIDSNNSDYFSILENKILDFIIDKISKENTYKDFSESLEKINSFLREYNKEKKENEYLNVILAVLNKNDFIFSELWKPSLYLAKETWETIEITDKKENKKSFSFISEWNLENNDILIIWTTRLLDYLSYSDFSDSTNLNKAERINKNIELIITQEKLEKNIGILTLKYINENLKQEKRNELKEKISKFWFKLMDNNFIKTILAYFKIIKEKLEEKSKLVKNILLIVWMLIATFILYYILSGTIKTVTNNEKQIENKQLFEQAIKYKTLASNNYSNPDKFNLNIKSSEEIIKKLKKEKVNLNNIAKLEEELNIIKKTFSWIETFQENDKNSIYKIPSELKNKIVKTVSIDKKVYLITNKNIIWPIFNWKQPKINIFKNLWNDDFVDATVLNKSIILLTKSGKIVEFISSWKFFFKDVLWQDTWEAASSILTYWNNNLYLVSKDTNQIFKHTKSWNNFKKAQGYLKPADSKSIWKILDIAIDWGFYILKNDLSIVKFFSNPYRLENIRLNNTPDTFKKYNTTSKTKILARPDLNYIYILLNNKIWIFKPNTRFYKSTKSLKYLGQIEWQNNKIIDFYIPQDWKIIVLNNSWVYNISWNENDWKILVNN